MAASIPSAQGLSIIKLIHEHKFNVDYQDPEVILYT